MRISVCKIINWMKLLLILFLRLSSYHHFQVIKLCVRAWKLLVYTCENCTCENCTCENCTCENYTCENYTCENCTYVCENCMHVHVKIARMHLCENRACAHLRKSRMCTFAKIAHVHVCENRESACVYNLKLLFIIHTDILNYFFELYYSGDKQYLA